MICTATIFTTRRDMEALKILQELIESEFKLIRTNLIWIRVGQGLTALAVGAGGGCLDIFSVVYHFFFSFSLSLGDGPI